MNLKYKMFLIIIALIVPLVTISDNPELYKEIDDVAQLPSQLSKINSFADEAIGVMDKGQLQNLTMNYGQISDVRYEDVGNAPTQFFYDFRYPRKNFTGLVDDFSIFFALPRNSKNGNNGNVIDGWTDNDNEDWIAKDGSYGATHYNPATDPVPHEEILYPPDSPTTPYLASSDLPATWPVDATGVAFWPGYFRRNAQTGEEIEGEFASDRDVYAVFNDGHNQGGNPIGIEVEMMAYCYGRPYADKFQFYEFYIHNTSDQTLDSCYVGYYEDPDCSDHGEEILILTDPTFSDPNIPDVIIQRDIDGDIGGATRPNTKGVTEDYSFATAILETPKNVGVTTFHYFQDSGPTDDGTLWPIITSTPTDADIASSASNFFHGTNKNFDDTELLYAEAKQDLVYIVASGPFSMEPGEVVKSVIAVAVGETDADVIAQMDQADAMYKFNFVGPSAPPAPTLSATKGDGQITLYWDAKSESTPDDFSGNVDFEGYRIYRSEDNGQTWGEEIRDVLGSLIGYRPLVQFDLDNDISGVDSRNPFTYLGDNTGLKHTFVDTDVSNGLTYSYTIVAYDQGDSSLYSLESSRGTTVADRNFVTITPEPSYSGKVSATVNNLDQVEGAGKGNISIAVVDEDQINLDNFEITFNNDPATSFNISNTTQNLLLAENLPFNFSDNPVVGGFQVAINSAQKVGGIESATDGFGFDVLGSGKKDSSASWFVGITEYATSTKESRTHDFEIRFVDSGDIAYSWGAAATSTASFQTNMEVWDVTTGINQKVCFEVQDVNGNQQWDEGESIFLLTHLYPDPQIGESLPAIFPDEFPYIVLISNYAGDAPGNPPKNGDILKINSYRSYGTVDRFTFNFSLPSIDVDQINLSEIRVVPNPYIVGAKWEELQNVHKIQFMFLPPVCTINVYTISGEKVWSQENNNKGYVEWNVTNNSNQALAFGVYVYVVSTPQGDKHIGKFSIIR